MADSKLNAGLITAAMAWRVKYRKVDHDGRIIRMKLRIEGLGVHVKNRGGVYPAGVRCRSLCLDVLDNGFVKEEFSHCAVAVEETPTHMIRSRGTDYVSGSSYNAAACSKDELLVTCFRAPYDDVRHMLLGHNHMMLILRAFLSAAHWDLEPNKAKEMKFCDDQGRLSLTAVAASTNAKEMAEVLADGLDCEVLGWKMDVEEPTAASIISQALNKGHEVALRTTELTAVAILRGEIIAQLAFQGQCVAFKTVRDRVRAQLDAVADDPDLPEVFDYLISAGVGKNSYIEDLLEFGSCFVDSKKRQLRLSAFAVANKIPAKFPWTKIAVVKRAYRKKPINGFCPSPETAWGSFEEDSMQMLEELLRFLHVGCKPLEKSKPQLRNKLLANIDVAATDAFFAAPKKRSDQKNIPGILLASTAKYLEPLKMQGEDLVSQDAPWIDFSKKEEEEKKEEEPRTSLETIVAPAVLQFHEQSGKQLNTQLTFPEEVKQKEAPIKLPWREWWSRSRSFGVAEADKAAAVAVLHHLHERLDMSSQPIQCWQREKVNVVVASEKVEANAILLPPCIPKQSRVVDRTEHPCAVMMREKLMLPTEDTVKSESGITSRVNDFFLLPEFKIPARREAKAAVAGTSPSDPEADEADIWNWGEGGDETMHPFWCVRRMTEKQLQAAAYATGKRPGQTAPRFNCKLQLTSISDVIIATSGGKTLCRTRLFEVPFLTNSSALEEGEELILEIAEKATQLKPKRSWIEAQKAEERATEKKKKLKAAQSGKKKNAEDNAS